MRSASQMTRRLLVCSAAIFMAAANAETATELFAPGAISTPERGCITFAPDGKTAYFAQHTPQPSRLMVSHLENNAWSAAQYLPFSGPSSGRMFDGDPTMSPDGSRLFFMSQRSKNDPTQIWSVTRQGDGWSEPKPVAEGGCGPSVAGDGTLYFCAKTDDTRGGTDIYRSRLVNGTYAAPENLGDLINSAANEYDAFIAPDQSYLIFTRVVSPGKTKFFIAERASDGWAAPRAIEHPGADGYYVCPVVSPDGQSFLFTGGHAGIFRVDTATLKPKRTTWSGARHFAPGVVSQRGNFGIAFAPGGNTVYFGKGTTIMVSNLRDGGWSTPEAAPFSGKYPDGDPSMSPDGSRLFFWSRRPAEGKPATGWWPDLWYVERQGSSWSEPHLVGGGANGEWSTFSLRSGSPSVAKDGTLYFFHCTSQPCNPTRAVRSKPVNGRYLDYEDLGETINGGNGAGDLTVAPDQSFIIIALKRPDALGGSDLYISHQRRGRWTEPRNLGPRVNSADNEFTPSISSDGKHLFFTRGEQGIFQVNMTDVMGR